MKFKDESILYFIGENFFLSNYYKCPVEYNGYLFSSSEAAYQSAKCKDVKNIEKFISLDPDQSKKLGRQIEIREDWDDVKIDIMYDIVKAKFLQNPILKTKLLDTGNGYLEEGNTWGDRFWGTCRNEFGEKEGENNLGFILMKVRLELQQVNPA